MRRVLEVLLFALLLFLLIALAAGCAASRGALRPDGSNAEVEPPGAETVDVQLLRRTAPEPRLAPPFSVSDESQGRWLTLFEVNVTPSEAAGVPLAPVESP